jgi:hypothetical protein
LSLPREAFVPKPHSDLRTPSADANAPCLPNTAILLDSLQQW